MALDFKKIWVLLVKYSETAMGRHVDAQSDTDSEYVKAVYKQENCTIFTFKSHIYVIIVLFLFKNNRMSHVVQARQMLPWLQPDWLFQLFPLGSEQKKCLSILHGFTDKVHNSGFFHLSPRFSRIE
jgi:hypothetical protein